MKINIPWIHNIELTVFSNKTLKIGYTKIGIFCKYFSVAEYPKSDEGGTNEARDKKDIHSSDKWGHRPSEEDYDFGSI
jgi:hypothetical protein